MSSVPKLTPVRMTPTAAREVIDRIEDRVRGAEDAAGSRRIQSDDFWSGVIGTARQVTGEVLGVPVQPVSSEFRTGEAGPLTLDEALGRFQRELARVEVALPKVQLETVADLFRVIHEAYEAVFAPQLSAAEGVKLLDALRADLRHGVDELRNGQTAADPQTSAKLMTSFVADYVAAAAQGKPVATDINGQPTRASVPSRAPGIEQNQVPLELAIDAVERQLTTLRFELNSAAAHGSQDRYSFTTLRDMVTRAVTVGMREAAATAAEQ